MTSIRSNRRRLIGVVIGVAVGLAAFVYGPRDLFDDDEAAAVEVVRDTGLVQATTLSTEYDADGTLAYASGVTAHVLAPPGETVVVGAGRSASTSVVPASLVITEQVAEGSIVESGDVLWRLGNEPTVALTGASPAYRDLAVDDEGVDVEQLEAALVALGYDPDETVTVDESFTANTEAMVERWQKDVGAEVDGVVHLGSVVFVPDTSRVGATTHDVGDSAIDGTAAFDLLALDTEVTFTLSAADRAALAVSDRVDVRVDGTWSGATVISTTVTGDGGANVLATLDESVELRADSVPVDVSWSIDLAVDVVTVPASALIRFDDGSYHVEVRDSAGVESWVDVEVGRSSDGRVEVAGDLPIGAEVIAP
ncbi:MAG: peptidoglycan-binding protein [Actinomycetota bacterium]